MDFDFGNKLMESCCVGNRFVDALTTLLTTARHGDRVVFCGDYAYDEVDRIRGRLAKAGILFKDEEGA